MKQCPTCHFTFADFHSVCTFDGTELVPYEKPQSLMKVAQPPAAHPRLNLKPLMSLTSLAVLTVFLSAVLIGYLKSPNPSIPAVAIQERDANSVGSTTRAGRTEEIRAESKRIARANRVRGNQNRRVATARGPLEVPRVVVRSPSPPIARPREAPQTSRVYPPSPTVARQREVQPAAREKPRKVVAILKTTWKVLKKPFDF